MAATTLPRDLKIGADTGLTEAEASRRLAAEGPNELPQARRRGVLAAVWGVVREPMILLLLLGGAIYLALGDALEALILMTFVFVVIGISFYQERRTENALEALRDLSSPRASVVRDRVKRRIPGREVVPGDIVLLAEGDRVPADAVIVSSSNLTIDESLLTGESVPVRKVQWDRESGMGRPGGDGTPFVYSGTLVVAGVAVTEVKATGASTELGRIGIALETLEPEETPLQREVRGLVKTLALLGLALAAALVIVYGLTRGRWLEGVLAGITLSMAMLPEEFPVVLTVFLALGAWRLSAKHVLTRRMPAVETLGSATVLCVDKTGTLTQNKMTVAGLWTASRTKSAPAAQTDGPDRRSSGGAPTSVAYHRVPSSTDDNPAAAVPDTLHELVEFGILASQRDPFDPMEKAFCELGDLALSGTEHLHSDWHLVREYPLSVELLALSHVWASPDETRYVIAAKGAPEAIGDLCHSSREDRERIDEAVGAMAGEGLRVLGVARAYFGDGSDGGDGAALPAQQHDFDFEFVGLVGLADPVRPEVARAVAECYTAGIRVVMITGDYPGTALAVAKEIGLKPLDRFVTGPEMDEMTDDQLAEQAEEVPIFARVVPEQKLRIVQALKAKNEVVAMTGDGVNDAPALKAAHIGVAMGSRGTDVAREAAALVLTDDAFGSIVAAVRMGRRVFDNLKKAMSYIFAVHVPIAGISLIPVALGLSPVLVPVHIAFLELIIDPASSIVFEAVPPSPRVMTRPPRKLDEPLFGRRGVWLPVAQGLVVLAVVLAVFFGARMTGQDSGEVRALTFTTLVVANLGLILVNLSWTRPITDILRSRNPALWWVLGGTTLFMTLALYVPAVRALFGFGVLGALDIAICLAAGGISVLWFEALKLAGLLKKSEKA